MNIDKALMNRQITLDVYELIVREGLAIDQNSRMGRLFLFFTHNRLLACLLFLISYIFWNSEKFDDLNAFGIPFKGFCFLLCVFFTLGVIAGQSLNSIFGDYYNGLVTHLGIDASEMGSVSANDLNNHRVHDRLKVLAGEVIKTRQEHGEVHQEADWARSRFTEAHEFFCKLDLCPAGDPNTMFFTEMSSTS